MTHCIIFLFILIITSPICRAENRALLVGIGDYDTESTGWRKIHGDKDIDLLTPLLKKQGFSITSLTNSDATKINIVNALKRFATECKSDDKVYLHFSCHGQPVFDCNGDENKIYDEAIVPYDAYRSEGYSKYQRRYNGENHLIDDEINPLLQAIRKRIGDNGILFIVFDACYSRGLEKGESDLSEEMDDIPEFMRGTNEYLNPSDKSYLRSIPVPESFSPGCLTAVLSACRENERNFEHKVGDKYYGSLSYCISLLLRQSADLNLWINYFQNKKYQSSGCFLKIQHPTITLYR